MLTNYFKVTYNFKCAYVTACMWQYMENVCTYVLKLIACVVALIRKTADRTKTTINSKSFRVKKINGIVLNGKN